ncbi:MAG: DNA primase [Bacilli bacterium]|nr:DNA primase [Bacilli bacterium]
MNLLTQEQLNNIRTSVNIVDVVSKYIPLAHKGSNYWGVCPFHSDTNPSLCVSPDKQIFTCFVCHKTGNAFNFIMEFEHVSFQEAVKKVADMGNVKVDINIKSKPSINNNLYKIYEDTNKIYQNNMNTTFGSEAKKYLFDREINDEIIKEFGIGLSIKARDVLVKGLSKKYEMKDLLESGLIIKTESGMIDAYQNRIMFPLWDLEGRIVGYSGRIYDTKEGSKYINSKESKIFKKGELLYNYHRSRDICRELDTVIVMEGFMDVIASYKVGVKNTVAMMGTAVTKYQANLIKRMASNIILLFDGDDAGAKATMRSVDELLELNVTPKVVRLEDNLDPDEYIKKYGKDAFIEKINNPMNIMDFKLSYLKNGKNLTSDVEKASYVNDILHELEHINDDILIELTLKKLSLESGLDVEFLKSKIVKEEKPKEKVTETKKVDIKTTKYEQAEATLLYYMLRSSDAINVYNDYVTNIRIQKYRFLARNILQFYKEFGKIDLAAFLDTLAFNQEALDTVGEIQSLNLKEDMNKDDLIECAKVIQEGNYKDAIKALEEQMSNTDNLEEKVKLSEEIRKLKVRRMKDVK